MAVESSIKWVKQGNYQVMALKLGAQRVDYKNK